MYKKALDYLEKGKLIINYQMDQSYRVLVIPSVQILTQEKQLKQFKEYPCKIIIYFIIIKNF